MRAFERTTQYLLCNGFDPKIFNDTASAEIYTSMISTLKQKGAWCSSAGSLVSWFQKRRSVAFHRVEQGIDVMLPNAHPNGDARVPGLRVRVYNPKEAAKSSEAYVETVLTKSMHIPLLCDSAWISCLSGLRP